MKVTAKDHGTIVSKVYLNDIDVTSRCFEADDENGKEEGYVKIYKKDENNNYIFTKDENGKEIVDYEILTGKVRIELIEGVS